MDELRDFSEDVKINKYKLDDECQEHPGIYHYYTNELSEAKSELDDQKDKLSFMESELELSLRRNPPEDIKITEQAIKSLIGSNNSLKRQREIVNEIKKRIYHLESAVKVLEHKKSMIKHLVDLFISRYYSEPSDGKKNKRYEELNDEMGNRLNRRR